VRISGGGVILAGAKPAAPPVNPSNGTISRAMAELVEAAAPRQQAEDGFGVHPNRVVRAHIGRKRPHLKGVGPEIPPLRRLAAPWAGSADCGISHRLRYRPGAGSTTASYSAARAGTQPALNP